jgi:hypothetical protein
VPYLFVLVAILFRLLPHPWNMTPIGAMFLFSGATFRTKTTSIAVPLAALLLSDYLVVRIVYHGFYSWIMTSPWPGFVLVAVIGWSLRKRITWARVVGASLAGAVVFFLASNFTFWMTGVSYPVTASGLRTCFIQAIPFFRNTVLGDLIYSGVFFGAYELVRRYRRSASGSLPIEQH